MLVKVQGRDVFYRPIARTRWRGKDEAEDQRLEREMLASEKERAEHIMLVDLGRNDLGRVCDYGTVKPENCSPSSATRMSCIWFPACAAASARTWIVSTR